MSFKTKNKESIRINNWVEGDRPWVCPRTMCQTETPLSLSVPLMGKVLYLEVAELFAVWGPMTRRKGFPLTAKYYLITQTPILDVLLQLFEQGFQGLQNQYQWEFL